jgi:hypothetical protein
MGYWFWKSSCTDHSISGYDIFYSEAVKEPLPKKRDATRHVNCIDAFYFGNFGLVFLASECIGIPKDHLTILSLHFLFECN